MEVGAKRHFWGGFICGCCHQCRLIAPFYIKQFVKRRKIYAADVIAVVDVVLCRNVRYFPEKSTELRA